jgi:hypothetical protein
VCYPTELVSLLFKTLEGGRGRSHCVLYQALWWRCREVQTSMDGSKHSWVVERTITGVAEHTRERIALAWESSTTISDSATLRGRGH